MAELTRGDLIRLLAAIPDPVDARPWIGRFAGVDFSGLDLSRFNFAQLDLSHAKFGNCKLVGTNFHCSLASSADFSGADLSEACFEEAVLSGARLTEAKLCHLRAAGVSAEETDFTGADFTGARMAGSTFVRAQFRLAQLDDVCISGSVVHQCQWVSARISGGDWSDLKPWAGEMPILPFVVPAFPSVRLDRDSTARPA